MSIITDHKPLVAIFKKDVAMLSQRIQGILLRIHQYTVRIIYKSGPNLFKADWFSRQNHKENNDTETPGMHLNINAMQTTTNIPDCITINELQQAISQDTHLQYLKEQIIQSWLEDRDQIPQDMRTYGIFQDDMAMVDGVHLTAYSKTRIITKTGITTTPC